MNETFYYNFENTFRGSKELIKSRLSFYLPLLLKLEEFYPNSINVDLGCGRGEWLELLKDHNISSIGIDLNEQFIKNSLDCGLNVKIIDCLDYLKTLENESVISITGFHIAEHLPFETLQSVIQQSFRVLKPGGLLILETPNPENLRVGTSFFYMDPTHIRPLPPQLLEFMIQHGGFQKTKIVHLSEDPLKTKPDAHINIADVIAGVSPDYSVIAQKPTSESIQNIFDSEFDKSYGITLEDMCIRYDSQMHQTQTEMHQTQTEMHQTQTEMHQIKTEMHQIKTEMHQFQKQILNLEHKLKKTISYRLALILKKSLEPFSNIFYKNRPSI